MGRASQPGSQQLSSFGGQHAVCVEEEIALPACPAQHARLVVHADHAVIMVVPHGLGEGGGKPVRKQEQGGTTRATTKEES